MKQNTLTQMSENNYRAEPSLSYSNLKLLLENPNKFYRKHFLKEHEEPTEAMKLGSAVHNFIAGDSINFEVLPSDVKGNIYIEGDGRQKEAFLRFEKSAFFKEEEWDIINNEKSFKFFHRIYKTLEDVKEAEKTKNILSFASIEKYNELTEALKRHEFYHLIKKEEVKKELSIFFNYQDVNFKVRMDGLFVGKENILIYDYKTTAGKFETKDIYKTIKTYAYNLQAYIYIQAVKLIYPDKPITFCIFLQNKEDPNNCVIVEIKENSFDGSAEKHLYEEAEAMFKKGVEIYKTYMGQGTDKEWLNKAPNIKFNLSQNHIMYLNNEIMANCYPQGGDDLQYDIEAGDGILNYNKKIN